MIIGHKKQWQFLKNISEKGNISHAFLFSGQDKLGKKKVAMEWISFLFGEDIEKKIHPDFTIIEPLEKEIKIGQIKELIRNLSLKPYIAPLKAIIIDKAHLMNSEAQSALLKTLEEPKGNTLLILVSEEPDRLLSTITSRVQTVKFYPVGVEEIKKGIGKEGIGSEEIINISLGSPGQALDLTLDNEKKIEFDKKIKEIDNLSKSDLCQRFEYVKTITEDSVDLKEIFKIWTFYFRNILIAKLSGKEKDNYSFKKLNKILYSIQSADYLISNTNVNSRLLLETLMIEI
ncbi:MAG: hypothetical protein ABID67_00905 [Candidatus Nealsonbacteria bacterium]